MYDKCKFLELHYFWCEKHYKDFDQCQEIFEKWYNNCWGV